MVSKQAEYGSLAFFNSNLVQKYFLSLNKKSLDIALLSEFVILIYVSIFCYQKLRPRPVSSAVRGSIWLKFGRILTTSSIKSLNKFQPNRSTDGQEEVCLTQLLRATYGNLKFQGWTLIIAHPSGTSRNLYFSPTSNLECIQQTCICQLICNHSISTFSHKWNDQRIVMGR